MKIYLPLLLETEPRRLLSRPRLRLLSFSLDLTDVGDSERIRLALYIEFNKKRNKYKSDIYENSAAFLLTCLNQWFFLCLLLDANPKFTKNEYKSFTVDYIFFSLFTQASYHL